MRFVINQKGVTLIETLAVTIIVALISSLILSILVNSNNTNMKQVKATNNLTDASFVLKVVTKDVRKTSTISIEDNQSTLNNGPDSSEQFIYSFDTDTGTLLRNGQVLVDNLKNFELSGGGNMVSIKVDTHSGQSINTTIYFRGGN